MSLGEKITNDMVTMIILCVLTVVSSAVLRALLI